MRRVLKWMLWAMPVLALLFVVFIHGILAVQAPLGAPVAVVEGWMPPDRLKEVAVALRARPVQHIHTTGTVRPFTYHLHVHERVEVELRGPCTGELRVRAAGLPGSRVVLLADSDTLDTWSLEEKASVHRFLLPRPVEHLGFLSVNDLAPDGTAENVAVVGASLGGENLHQLQRHTWRVMADGERLEGWPTYAHAAAQLLIANGVPADRIIPVPAWGRPDSRSWANAATFGLYAQQHGYTAVDVYTLGVHARRSRNLFRRGCGPGIDVGVISIPDPRCAAEDWWRHWRGWFYVLKEVAGASEPYAVDLTH